MFNKLPMNLQFFAEGSPAPEAGAPTGAEATNTEQSKQPQEGSQRTFTQEEVDKMVQKRMARYDRDHQGELENARNAGAEEANKLAKMTKDQRKEHELEEANRKAESAQAELARYKMRDTARKQLVEGGYTPTDEDIDLIVTDKAESTQQNVQAVLSMIERVKSSTRDEMLKGETPKITGDPVKKPQSLKGMSIIERAELKQNDPQAYAELARKAGY